MHTPPPSRIINRPSHNKSGLLGLFLSCLSSPCQSSSCHHITSPRIAHRIASQLPSVDVSASRPALPLTFFFSPSHLDKTIDFFLFCRADTIRFDTTVAVHFLTCKCCWFPYLLRPSSSVLLSCFWGPREARHDNEGGRLWGGVQEQDIPRHTKTAIAIATTSICLSPKPPAARQLSNTAARRLRP